MFGATVRAHNSMQIATVTQFQSKLTEKRATRSLVMRIRAHAEMKSRRMAYGPTPGVLFPPPGRVPGRPRSPVGGRVKKRI